MVQYFDLSGKDTIEARVRKRFPGLGRPDTPPHLQLRAEQYRQELKRIDEDILKQLAPIADPLENTPGADFDYYAKLSYWTIDEAVSLSFGKHGLVWDNVRIYLQWSAIAREFGARREIAERARHFEQLWEQTIPSVFLAWAERTHFPMPAELVAAVEAMGVQIADWKTRYDESRTELAAARGAIDKVRADHLRTERGIDAKLRATEATWKALASGQAAKLEALSEENSTLVGKLRDLQSESAALSAEKPGLSTRERQTLLKIIIGQAIKNYGFDPKRARNSASAEIAGDLRTVGISIDEDTIRKYLNEAKDTIDLPELE